MLVPSAIRSCDASTSATTEPPLSRRASTARCLASLAKGTERSAPLKRAVAGKRQPIALARRPAGHGALGRGNAGPRQQPARQQRLGKRYGGGEAAGLAQHGEAVGHLGAGAA